MTRAFHAPGLPYTVLLDREGKIVQRWVGYSGVDQATQIRAAIQLELGADRPATPIVEDFHLRVKGTRKESPNGDV